MWSPAGHQGLDVALLESGGAVEGHRPEAPDLAKPPDSCSADGEHLHDLGHPQQAFRWLLGPFSELGRTPAAGQDGFPVLQGKGWIEFKGRFDEPVETGNHGDLMSEEWKWVKGTAGTS